MFQNICKSVVILRTDFHSSGQALLTMLTHQGPWILKLGWKVKSWYILKLEITSGKLYLIMLRPVYFLFRNK